MWFVDVDTEGVAVEREWTADGVAGSFLSLSVCVPAGAAHGAAEAAFRSRFQKN